MNKVQQGNNNYCGPAALSVISGHTVDHCAYVIGRIIGKAPDKVKGVTIEALFEAADRMRISHKEVQPQGISLYAVASNLVRNEPATYLVTLPKHYVVIEVTKDRQIYICDNHTKEPLNLAGSSRLSQKVERVWACSPKPPAIELKPSLIIEQSTNLCIIKILHEFVDPTDNYMSNLGSISANRDMMKVIMKKLVEYYKDE